MWTGVCMVFISFKTMVNSDISAVQWLTRAVILVLGIRTNNGWFTVILSHYIPPFILFMNRAWRDRNRKVGKSTPSSNSALSIFYHKQVQGRSITSTGKGCQMRSTLNHIGTKKKDTCIIMISTFLFRLLNWSFKINPSPNLSLLVESASYPSYWIEIRYGINYHERC